MHDDRSKSIEGVAGHFATLEARSVSGTEADAIADIARASVSPEVLHTHGEHDVMYVTLPEGAEASVIDLEKYGTQPRRKNTTSVCHELADLIRYTKRHRIETQTTLWVDVVGASVLSVINDHSAEDAAWRDHRATHKLRSTEQWKHWTSKHDQLMPQSSFAEHVEDGALSIVDPDAATMLEIAESFHANSKVHFKQAQRLRDGNLNLEYTEETTASAGVRGDVQVPQTIGLSLAVFEGQPPVHVQARLRYRLSEGKLLLGYKIVDVDEVLRAAFDLVEDQLVEAFDREVVFRGVA